MRTSTSGKAGGGGTEVNQGRAPGGVSLQNKSTTGGGGDGITPVSPIKPPLKNIRRMTGAKAATPSQAEPPVLTQRRVSGNSLALSRGESNNTNLPLTDSLTLTPPLEISCECPHFTTNSSANTSSATLLALTNRSTTVTPTTYTIVGGSKTSMNVSFESTTELTGAQFLSSKTPTKYRRIKLLGEGGCGLVWVVERTSDGTQLAAKVVPLSKTNEFKRRYAMDEPIFTSMCDSAFIVRYIDHWTDKKTAVVTVMDLVEGVDLNTHIRTLGTTAAYHLQQARRLARGLPEIARGGAEIGASDDRDIDFCNMSPQRMQQLEKKNPAITHHLQASAKRTMAEPAALVLFAQMLLGMHHVHSRGIIHRDIKAGNVFLCNSGLAKIGDFGLSCLMDDGGDWKSPPAVTASPPYRVKDDPFLAICAVGTATYMAPELWCTENMPPYSAKSDMWALGVVLYEMLTCRRPFPRDTKEQTGAAILRRAPVDILSFAPDASPAVIDLVHALMHPDPSCRPTALETLRMPLIQRTCQSMRETLRVDTTISKDVVIAAIDEIDSVTIIGNDPVGSKMKQQQQSSTTTTGTTTKHVKLPRTESPTICFQHHLSSESLWATHHRQLEPRASVRTSEGGEGPDSNAASRAPSSRKISTDRLS